MYLAAAVGEYSGELPEPKTRLEYYLKKIKEAVENGSSVNKKKSGEKSFGFFVILYKNKFFLWLFY